MEAGKHDVADACWCCTNPTPCNAPPPALTRFDFDPLDVTKTWPEDIFPLQPVGRMVRLGSLQQELAFGRCAMRASLRASFQAPSASGLLTFQFTDNAAPSHLAMPRCSTATPTTSLPRTSRWRSAPPSWCPVSSHCFEDLR